MLIKNEKTRIYAAPAVKGLILTWIIIIHIFIFLFMFQQWIVEIACCVRFFVVFSKEEITAQDQQLESDQGYCRLVPFPIHHFG